MAHYQAVKPWCELILNRQMPIALIGEWRGLSLLFPMEKLFEKYVEGWVRDRMSHTGKITAPASRHSLCVHEGMAMFRLEPDLLLEYGQEAWVLDTKWKRLKGDDRVNKYGLSQADFYQLFSYGHRYLGGAGELALIYPRTSQFSQPLPVFEFSPELKLWVLPFDLDEDELLIGEAVSFARLLKRPQVRSSLIAH
jgi:5-methylcytosine-specific restriction enzyme subunit McrC